MGNVLSIRGLAEVAHNAAAAAAREIGDVVEAWEDMGDEKRTELVEKARAIVDAAGEIREDVGVFATTVREFARFIKPVF